MRRSVLPGVQKAALYKEGDRVFTHTKAEVIPELVIL